MREMLHEAGPLDVERLSKNDRALLASEAAAPVLARLDGAVTEFFPDRDRHVRSVALVVLKAKGLG